MLEKNAKQIADILHREDLSTVFQPIVDIQNCEFLGVEALTRGPQGSALHSPYALFSAAEQCGQLQQLEYSAILLAARRFAKLDIDGLLFVNISPMSLSAAQAVEAARTVTESTGLTATDIVLELSEQYHTDDIPALCQTVRQFQSLGFRVAVDDLGAGYAGLKLWSQLRPDFVKIDRHFISGIDADPIKREFVRSILTMSKEIRSHVIAEGVETLGEANVLRELGIRYAQGYLFGRPATQPTLDKQLNLFAARPDGDQRILANRKVIGSLAQDSPSIDVNTPLSEVMRLFKSMPEISSLPVLLHNSPTGIITRQQVLEIFSDRFGPELHARKPVAQFMLDTPIVVEANTTLEEVSHLLTEDDQQDLIQDFIIAHRGCYRGMGKTAALLRAITHLQISSARHANPLTQLPGNVPINEHIQWLINQGHPFSVAYCDINSFKAFNDTYGYALGDKAILILAGILNDSIDYAVDFVGHIGGDDFIMLLRSDNALATSRAVCSRFTKQAHHLYKPEHREQRGVWSQDRQGNSCFFPLMSLSIGLVQPEVNPQMRVDDISTLATDAKKKAKQLPEGGVYLSDARFPGQWRAVG